ncbi:hypothetical protein T484DRAFT_1910264, partial [Baffinella frigidus]
MPRFNRRVSQHNAEMDNLTPSPSHYTSEQEAHFPFRVSSRRLPRCLTAGAIRKDPMPALPPNTAGKDVRRSASNEETRFHCSDELLGPSPTRSALNPTLRFPLQFYALGQCLTHPDCTCKCVKPRVMAQSQGSAWRELGSRCKYVKCVEGTVSPPRERTTIS